VRLELSWSVDSRGRRAVIEQGGGRYPIGYPQRAGTTGFTFSAPYISDTARHGQAKGRVEFNAPLNQGLRDRIPAVMRDVVLPELGAKGLGLLRAGRRVDAELLDACLDIGAVPVTGRGSKPFRVPVRWDEPWTHSRALSKWIPPHLRQLDPAAPEWFRHELVKREDQRWVVVKEEQLLDLLRRPVDAEACPWRSLAEWRRFMKDLSRLGALLDLLARVPVHVRRVWNTAGIHLPDRNGSPRPLEHLVQAVDVPPSIPGTPDPYLLHPTLSGHVALRSGSLEIPPFDESAHARLIVSGELSYGQREEVYRWLLTCADTLRFDALRHLKNQAIWKTRQGEFVVFTELCEPAQRTVTRVLASVLHRPEPALLKLRRVRRRQGSPLALRRDVKAEALAAWHRQELAAKPGRTKLRRLEADMLALSRLKGLQKNMKTLASQHRTLSAGYQPARVRDLHLRSVAANFALRPRDTAWLGSPSQLLELLGARRQPSAEALQRALVEDVDPSKFERRIGALFQATPSESVRSVLAAAPIVPVGGAAACPNRIALLAAGHRVDAWGDWRQRIDQDRFSPTTRRHLRVLGAVTYKVSAEASVAFFKWLSKQSVDVVRRHLQQVMVHWRSPHGPREWGRAHPSLPNLPVVVEGRVSLIPAKAWHRARLPDHERLAAALVASETTLPLVLVRTDLRWSPFSLLREHVSSLRDTARRIGVAAIQRPGGRHVKCEAVLADLQRRAVRDRLHTYLARIAGAEVELRGGGRWLNKIRFREVRRADALTQKFKVGNHRAVGVEVHHASKDGVLFVASAPGEELEVLFEALAELMLVGTIRPMHAMALRQAFAKAVAPQQPRWAPWSKQAPDQDTGSGNGGDDGPGEGRHAPLEPDPKANLPTETTLEDDGQRGSGSDEDPGSSTSEGELEDGDGDGGGGVPDNSDDAGDEPTDDKGPKRKPSRPANETEARHRAQLMESYAAHCQVCLADKQPAALAPEGSYVAPFELRSRVMDAHHLKHYASGGGRHGGNLLVLCYLHHRNLGDDIAPVRFVEALRDAVLLRRTFSSAAGDKTVSGCLVRVDTPKGELRSFFVEEHRRYWLTRAGVTSPKT